MKSETCVIGAGTAGLLLASSAAKMGLKVSVYDTKARPGMPPSASGILSIKGLDGLGIPYMSAVRNTLYGARIHAGSAQLTVLAKEKKAYVLDRPALNEILISEAEKNGARIVLGSRITARELDVFSRSCIIAGADGAVSMVSKHFRMGAIRKYVLTYKAVFELPNDERSVDLYFDNSIAPGFFAWLCPISKYEVEAGIGVDSSRGNAKLAFSRFMAKYAKSVLGDSKMLNAYASIIPISSAKQIVNEEHEVLLVGDAAGQVKASTGGGIIYGGNAALMAAKAIYEHVMHNAPLGAYSASFSKLFGTDMRLHGLVRLLYSSLSPGSMSLLIKALAKLGFGDKLSKYGDMDSVLLTFKRMLHLAR
ncbi:MAG: NAD(P)/FAD-dependent oxidoreductase [Candidatus Micrarchaeaceae archaeon]